MSSYENARRRASTDAATYSFACALMCASGRLQSASFAASWMINSALLSCATGGVTISPLDICVTVHWSLLRLLTATSPSHPGTDHPETSLRISLCRSKSRTKRDMVARFLLGTYASPFFAERLHLKGGSGEERGWSPSPRVRYAVTSRSSIIAWAWLRMSAPFRASSIRRSRQVSRSFWSLRW